MWSSIGRAFKRPGTPSVDHDENSAPAEVNVMSSLYEQHPNLSVFHPHDLQDPQDVPFPSPSPPNSPSNTQGGRRRLLKRISKNPFNDTDADSQASGKLNVGTLKKVKSSLHSLSTGECRGLLVPLCSSFPECVLMAC